MSKIIAVCGSTGAQGGAVVDALLKYPKFKVRGLTRNTESEKANALRKKGVEVVKADFNNSASLEKAFEGCHGAYLVTNYFESLDPKTETEQGKRIVDAAKKVGVQHVVWSTFEDTRDFKDDVIPIMENNYKVPHFDSKADVGKYINNLNMHATHLYTAFYADNWVGTAKFQNESGVYKLTLPMKKKKLAVVVVEDIGKMAAAAFDKDVTGDLGVASEHLTGDEICDILSEVTGRKFVYNEVPADAYRSFGFPLAVEFGNMFQFYEHHDEKFLELRSMEKVKKLITPISLREWATKNKDNLFSD